METTNEILALLEQIPQPVFLVKENTVVHVNQSARLRNIEENTPVSDLISIGMPEYAQFTDGTLLLTVSINNISYNTVVTKNGGYDMFLLESEFSDYELRSLALAAQTLRQPLSSAMISIDKLMPEEDIQQSPALRQQLQMINRSIYQLHRTIRNMSDAAIYRSRCSANIEVREAVAVITEIIEKAACLTEKADHRIEFKTFHQPVFCPLDRDKLERAILNLISNAIKYASAGSAIQVSLHLGNQKLYISVQSDSADPEHTLIKNIFSGFTREPGIRDARSGIGLGLTIAHGVAAAHRGTLLVEQASETCLRFTLSVSLQPNRTGLRSPVLLPVDDSGGYDQALIELSDVLPAELFQ